MKINLSLAVAAAFGATTWAFGPSLPSTQQRSSTSLYISSWGTKGPPSKWSGAKKQSPEADVQAYIPAPEAVDARINLEGTVLISGLVKSQERTDQTIFDLINSEVSAYEYDKIVAFVDDVKFSKKRLLSRSARYTGLLDKLDFIEASEAGALPTPAQLEGVAGWVAYVEGDNLTDQVKAVADIAKQAPSVQNVALLLVGANDLDQSACQEAVESLKNMGRDDLDYTLVAVGELTEAPEGAVPYRYMEFDGDKPIPKDAKFSRAESLRMVTELLQLTCGKSKCLSFVEVSDPKDAAHILIKGLRAAGYPRPLEVDHMIRKGVEDYEKAIQDFKEGNPDAQGTSDNWWEDEEFLKNVKSRSSLKEKKSEEESKDARTQEIEDIAKEWAKREYFRQTMEGTVKDMTEEEFTKSVWDRALFEGDLKYRQVHGEATDQEAEFDDFKKRQEKKKEAMLKRAKAELSEILEEENLGGADLEEKLATLKAEDDNTSED